MFMPMQHAEIFFVFVIVVVLKSFLVAFLLPGCLVRLIVCRRVIQCELQTFAEILEVAYGSSGWLKILNLHLSLPLDGDSKL